MLIIINIVETRVNVLKKVGSETLSTHGRQVYKKMCGRKSETIEKNWKT